MYYSIKKKNKPLQKKIQMSVTLRELKDSLGPNPSPRTRQEFNQLARGMGQNNDVVQLEGGGLMDNLAKHAKKAGAKISDHVKSAAKTATDHLKESAKNAGAEIGKHLKEAGTQITEHIKDQANKIGEGVVEGARDAVKKAVEKVNISPRASQEEDEGGEKKKESGGCALM